MTSLTSWRLKKKIKENCHNSSQVSWQVVHLRTLDSRIKPFPPVESVVPLRFHTPYVSLEDT